MVTSKSAHVTIIIDEDEDDFNEEVIELDKDEQELYNFLEDYQSMKRYDINNFDEILVDDGLFLVFEEGETFYGLDRIVYVGQNFDEGNLSSVVKRYFFEGDKEHSVLRKYIGAALLRKKNDPFFKKWMNDDVDPEDKRVLATEEEVTKYMTSHMWVSVLPKRDVDARKEKSKQLIRQLKEYYLATCAQSGGWLGNSSSEISIRAFGMWEKSHNPKKYNK